MRNNQNAPANDGWVYANQKPEIDLLFGGARVTNNPLNAQSFRGQVVPETIPYGDGSRMMPSQEPVFVKPTPATFGPRGFLGGGMTKEAEIQPNIGFAPSNMRTNQVMEQVAVPPQNLQAMPVSQGEALGTSTNVRAVGSGPQRNVRRG